jgi:hypothetical protein
MFPGNVSRIFNTYYGDETRGQFGGAPPRPSSVIRARAPVLRACLSRLLPLNARQNKLSPWNHYTIRHPPLPH